MKLYSGRLPDGQSPLMEAINRSLPFDIRLLPYDVHTNRAWARELARLGVFTGEELTAVEGELDRVKAAHAAGAYDPLPADEDVHTLVERELTEALGETGAKIHTGRSRNDQVACDVRLYTVDALDELAAAVLETIAVLVQRATEYADTPMAGTTHLQPALPITLGHFLLSLAAALQRDLERIRDARGRANRCPLGAGAMAGSGFPVDREALARDLGFTAVLPNSIDAVSDRDFCQEAVFACAVLAGHLSRYAEQFVLWANPALGYVRFSGEWSTGSSMMPQKRNPDAMELVRGKSARLIGATAGLLSLTKGLPLTYAKDLQEDKEPLFDALDTALLVTRVFALAVQSATFNPEAMKRALTGDLLATDLADALARAGVPFRQAHHRVGAWVSELEAAGRTLLDASDDELRARFPEFGEHPPVLDFERAIAAREVAGGTAPSSVRRQIDQLTAWLANQAAHTKNASET